MDDYKKYWDTRDLTNLEPILFPINKQVYQPYTDVEPPEGDVIIKGFNFNTNTWQYEQTVPVAQYQQLSIITANLMKDVALLKQEIEDLKGDSEDVPVKK